MSFRVLPYPEDSGATPVAEMGQSAFRLSALSADGANPSLGNGETNAPLETCSLAAHETSNPAPRPTELIARRHGRTVETPCDARRLRTEGGECVKRLIARLPHAIVFLVASLALFVGGFADGR